MNVNDRKLKVIARNSPLSLIQVKEAFSSLPPVEYALTGIASFGDRHKEISLMDEAVAEDFFTRELDEALLNGEADVAVHSAKDLPYPLPAGLELYCLTEAATKVDALVSRSRLRLAELPPGARIGASSAGRKAEVLKRRPDLMVVGVRGTIEERIAQVDSGYVDALVVAACALSRLGLEGRIAEELPFKTHPLQGCLAVVGRAGNPALKTFFAVADIRRTYGKATLVGFGPGNPDLLTVGGEKALQRADVIFHDDLVDKDSLEKYGAAKVYVGKRRNKHLYRQDEINELVYEAAVSGKNTVRLKGGDPMVFARGREELDFLKSRFVDVAVIPGISSGTALAACTHIPLTHRGVASSVAFATGHSIENLPLPNADTLVYFMAGANISAIAGKMIAAGRAAATPAALVYNVSLPGQETFFSTLGELQFSAIKYPAPLLVVVGDVVSLESGNAGRRKALATGSTCETCNDRWRLVTHTPLIKIQKADVRKVSNRRHCEERSDEAIRDAARTWSASPFGFAMTEKNDFSDARRIVRETIGSYQWIIFTSRYGVRFFFEILDELSFDIRALGTLKIASVGKTTTAELKKYRLYPEIEPATESAEGLVACFKEAGITDSCILLPRSDKGLTYLSDELQALGNRVTDVTVYENVFNSEASRVDLSDFREILFASPSGVDAFKRLYGALPEGILLLAKGKTTENKLKSEI
ncbi:MAG: uroporphyrinogen-III C-methyltransferase [Tannerella sp.]|jgi:uroporphyrinogen III methyltransferase/synthase|nr:uroporphyrinogen-III C-methyltransferase [Tannerella sp.]